MNSNIGEYIRQFRLKKGITQRELADLLFCTQQHIALIEKGKRPLSHDYLLPLSRILNFNFIQFVNEEHKFQNAEHYIIAHKLIDYIHDAEYIKMQALLKLDVIENEFNYESAYTIKEYCKALVYVNVENNYKKAESVLLNVLNISSREDIVYFSPVYSIEERYFSCVVLLSLVLCHFKENLLSKTLLITTIDFMEKEYFDSIFPITSINAHIKRIYIALLNNYADDLYVLEYYEEALTACDKTLEKINLFKTNYLLELILRLKIETLYALGEIEEAQDVYGIFHAVCILKNIPEYLIKVNSVIKHKCSLIKTYDFK